MVQKREAYAPWSLTRKAGVQSATVNGDIEVPQFIQPVLDTGFVDEKGDWKGSKSSEEQFHSFGLDEAIANGASILAPQASGTIWPLDMTGYNHVVIAIKPSNGGNFGICAVQGPNDQNYANLNPVIPAVDLRYAMNGAVDAGIFHKVIDDTAEALTADGWNILHIQDRAKNQKLLQFKITNSSGGESDIETAFMRLV
jgi:hypothetical protein